MNGGNVKIPIPDYKIYKVGEHTPELLNVQKKLAARGLKDPWLRNEVWRYDVNYSLSNPTWKWVQATRGMPIGLVLGFIGD